MNTVIRTPRLIALVLAASLAAPTLAMTTGCGNHSDNTPVASGPNNMDNSGGPSTMAGAPPAKPGLTTKQKVVLLAGAALLFYLYQRDKSQNAANAAGTGGGHPQLYREDAPGANHGAIYYHKNDAQHTVVWLQAPAQGVQVPADQVQQYLPDYNNNPNAYQGQVNTNPQAGNGQVQSATQYDPSLSGG